MATLDAYGWWGAHVIDSSPKKIPVNVTACGNKYRIQGRLI
ncbi:MAG: hypothetical protein PVI42_25410 [Desulfobacterales bacterium]